MEPDFGPFPDCESARNWLEERLHLQDRRMEQYVGPVDRSEVCSFVKRLTSQQVAESVKCERMENSKVVRVSGYDTTRPDTDILKAMAEHFSSCGEILGIQLSRLDIPNRVVLIDILGEDAKEKAEQLNGSDLGGCKLDVKVRRGTPTSSRELSKRIYFLSGTVRRELDLKANKAKKRKLSK